MIDNWNVALVFVNLSNQQINSGEFAWKCRFYVKYPSSVPRHHRSEVGFRYSDTIGCNIATVKLRVKQKPLNLVDFVLEQNFFRTCLGEVNCETRLYFVSIWLPLLPHSIFFFFIIGDQASITVILCHNGCHLKTRPSVLFGLPLLCLHLNAGVLLVKLLSVLITIDNHVNIISKFQNVPFWQRDCLKCK